MNKAKRLHDEEERRKRRENQCGRCHEDPCKCDAGERL